FAGKELIQRLALGLFENGRERPPLAARLLPGAIERRQPPRLDQEALNQIEPFIAGRALDPGKPWHRLAVGEDLLDEDGKRAAGLRPQPSDEIAQAPAIAGRISEPIDVIEPKAIDRPGGDQRGDARMNLRERALILDPQPGERVDVEEAPVIG